VLEIEHDPSAPEYLEYDVEWLTVLRATDDLINVTGGLWNMPEDNGLHTRCVCSLRACLLPCMCSVVSHLCCVLIPEEFACLQNGGRSKVAMVLGSEHLASF
jgi:hypothetical protein